MNPFIKQKNVELRDKARAKLRASLDQYLGSMTRASIEAYVNDMDKLPELEYRNMAVLAGAIAQYDFIKGERTQHPENEAPGLNEKLLGIAIENIKYDQKEKKQKKTKLKPDRNYEVLITSNIFTYVNLLSEFYASR